MTIACIQITEMPKSEVPQKILEGWIGLVIPIQGPKVKNGTIRTPDPDSEVIETEVEGYEVSSVFAFSLLLDKPDAMKTIDWYTKHAPNLIRFGGSLLFREGQYKQIFVLAAELKLRRTKQLFDRVLYLTHIRNPGLYTVVNNVRKR